MVINLFLFQKFIFTAKIDIEKDIYIFYHQKLGCVLTIGYEIKFFFSGPWIKILYKSILWDLSEAPLIPKVCILEEHS